MQTGDNKQTEERTGIDPWLGMDFMKIVNVFVWLWFVAVAAFPFWGVILVFAVGSGLHWWIGYYSELVAYRYVEEGKAILA